MRSDLSATEVAAWLRQQAKTFASMADTIEATFNLVSPPQPQNNPITNASIASHSTAAESEEWLVPEVKKILSGRARRLSDIALALGRTEERVEPLLTPEHGFVKADRGWYRVQSTDDHHKNGQPMLLTGEEGN